MQKLTLKSCLTKAEELGIEVVGDVSFRGDCNAEDSDLASFFAWVRFTYPEYNNMIFHISNEFKPQGRSSYCYHAKEIAKGRVDGLADVICLPISIGAPCFICELKRKDISKSLASKKRKEHFVKQISILKEQCEFGATAFIALGLCSIKQSFVEHVKKHKGS